MAAVRTMTVSRLKTYLNCPRQYFLQYVRRARSSEPRSSLLVLGDLVHRCMVRYHQTPCADAPDIIECVNAVLSEATDCDAQEIAGARDDVTGLLRDYDRSLGQLITTPCECEVSFWAQMGSIRLYSRADVLWREDEVLNVGDWKLSLPPLNQQLLQHVFLHSGVRTTYPDLPVRHRIIALRPSPVVADVLLTEATFRTTLHTIYETAKQIEREEEWRPVVGIGCQWCSFAEMCDATGQSIEKMVF